MLVLQFALEGIKEGVKMATKASTWQATPVGRSVSKWEKWLDKRFHVRKRGSTVSTEVRGGLATFFTMAYIIVLNPLILAGAADVTGAHLSIAQLTAATALVAAVMTFIMGVYANYPFAIAAGLGLNGVVAFQLAGQMTWPAAMGVVVLEGLLISALVMTGLRE
jgi:AGZA family xanthine/uracil permease-like MFS transporter